VTLAVTHEPLSALLFQQGGAVAHARFTERSDGDLSSVGSAGLRAVVDRRWTLLDQVHGAGVVHVDEPGQGSGVAGDVAVTTAFDTAVAVRSADCVPIALLSEQGPVAVVHAGWRGLVAGVIESAVAALGDCGAVHAVLGPHIGPECYEFGADDLEMVVTRYGESARSTTRRGRAALDLGAAVEAALEASGAVSTRLGGCTSCEIGRYWSHRGRGEESRQGVVVWRTR